MEGGEGWNPFLSPQCTTSFCLHISDFFFHPILVNQGSNYYNDGLLDREGRGKTPKFWLCMTCLPCTRIWSLFAQTWDPLLPPLHGNSAKRRWQRWLEEEEVKEVVLCKMHQENWAKKGREERFCNGKGGAFQRFSKSVRRPPLLKTVDLNITRQAIL